jgi:hypothetical protein
MLHKGQITFYAASASEPPGKRLSEIKSVPVHLTFHDRNQEQFGMDQDGLLAFRSWILDHRCRMVAVESTGNYWYPIFCILEGHVEFILANAWVAE